ncbi:MAG: bifunctional demethylmenaquinone methyltransferase/2-methoxy-6-polyprenyl-1,4-benzoquinol methylase UbiE [Bacteroidia bacterium]
MNQIVTPYKDQATGKKEQVATMFNNIAHRYDFLNQLLSLGIHKGWRRKAVKMIGAVKPKNILDIATGTGDFAIEAMTLDPLKVTGVDISEGMLKFGVEKVRKLGLSDKIELKKGDSENLPFTDSSFDAITVGFGVRNFENLEKGINEIWRVLKPGGMIAILEFSKPRKFPVKQFYHFYFRFITPFIGRIFSKDSSAYTYLPESVKAFPDGDDFLAVLKKAGFKEVKARPLTFGIASIYSAVK